jgi:hypothetical protein
MIKSSFKLIIRIPKAHSAFTYFQLEANENLCFYSTLEESMGQPYRDLKIQGSVEFYDETKRLLDVLAKDFSMEYLEDLASC